MYVSRHLNRDYSNIHSSQLIGSPTSTQITKGHANRMRILAKACVGESKIHRKKLSTATGLNSLIPRLFNASPDKISIHEVRKLMQALDIPFEAVNGVHDLIGDANHADKPAAPLFFLKGDKAAAGRVLTCLTAYAPKKPPHQALMELCPEGVNDVKHARDILEGTASLGRMGLTEFLANLKSAGVQPALHECHILGIDPMPDLTFSKPTTERNA